MLYWVVPFTFSGSRELLEKHVRQHAPKICRDWMRNAEPFTVKMAQMLSTSIPYFDIYIDFGAEGLRDKNGKRFEKILIHFQLRLSNFFNDKTLPNIRKN